jgi:hypothetical protein
MKKALFKLFAAAMVGAWSLATVSAQDSGALVDALVKKGVLTSQEGEEIRAQLLSEFTESSAGKLNIASHVKVLRLYGDARFRYELNKGEAQNVIGHAQDNRYRYRLRIGADYTLTENWNAGVRFETQTDSTSTNQDLGAFFDKTNDTLNIGLAFLGYSDKNVLGFIDDFKFVLGKHVNPFYVNGVNGFVWDTDLNPEGFSEDFGWKNVGVDKLDLNLRGGQYLISNVNNTVTLGANDAADAFMFVGQLEAKYEWASKSGIKVAPMGIVFTEESIAPAQSSGGALRQDINDSAFLLVPAEVYFNLWERPVKVYGTYGYNFGGSRRNSDPSAPVAERGASAKNQLFNVGVTYGNARTKGQWDITGEYRYIESNAFTRNMQDSDFNGGRGNAHGPVLSFGYNFTDFLQARTTWFHAMNIDKTQAVLAAGATPTQTVGHSADVLQVDIAWRF